MVEHKGVGKFFALPIPWALEQEFDKQTVPETDWGKGASKNWSKKRFWSKMEHPALNTPIQPQKSIVRDLISPERLEELSNWQPTLKDPQMGDQPDDVYSALEERSPQFTLRNLTRPEMDAWVDDLWWNYVKLRETLDDLGLDQIRACDLVPSIQWTDELSAAKVNAILREFDQLFYKTDWTSFEWRIGPRKPEYAE